MVVPESSINNIMGGLESTGGVRLHNHRRKLKQRFDIVKKLGQGTYGKVQLGINKETGQEVAIKTIKKCKIETEADLIRIRREIQIMSSVQHPNIIHIYEVFENREKMVLVMEYAAGGELYDFLSERKVLAEEEARRIFRQIATAVYYCHKHKICHRDLKLENILLDENGNAKIADFGLSNVFDESRLLGTFCGSPLYASPEIVKGTPYHGPEVDCWSLGVLLYTLVYGAMPFDGSNFKRLVRQISQGDYFEPKKPSPASALIRDMLNVDPGRRADITAVCSHWWLDEGQSASCLAVAEELACLTPVRLDLLLCLAPPAAPSADSLIVSDQGGGDGADRPLRSQSLSSLATASAQPDFLPDATVAATPTQARRDTDSRSKRKEEGGSVKRKDRSRSRRERSSSRSRRDESTPEPDTVSEKPKRKSVKARKTSSEPLVLEEPKAEDLLQPKITEVEEELVKSSETILAPRTPVDEVPKEKSPVPSDEVVIEELKSKEEEEKLEEPTTPKAETPKQPSPAPSLTKKATPPPATEKTDEKLPEDEVLKKPMERRKSKIFETAEKFNKIGTTDVQQKPQPKKMVLPGVKVSDAKKAYERRSSLASSTNFIRGSASRKSLSGESSLSPPVVEDTKFSLASSVALNKLVENVERLSKLEDEQEKEKSLMKSEDTVVEEGVKPSSQEKVIEVKREESKGEEVPKADEETRKKVKNAVQVIGNAITEGISSAETKAATLPRRKTSRAEIKLAMPTSKPPEFRSEVEHMVGTPVTVQRSEVKFPVSAASPAPRPAATVRQGSSPREYIVPIQVEQEGAAVKPPPPPTPIQRPVSRTSSKSLSRQSTLDSDLGSTASMGEPIRKSPREVIIPIAVEGGGFVTPSADAISRVSSVNESEDDMPRGFGLHSARRRQLETADSVSSDEDDDNFEILTAENLFSTLLSRVRSLTHRLNTEDRQAFPRLFNHHSIFDIPPSRRLTEARSFGRADSVPWRRSASREGAGGLPRDGSFTRIGTPQRTTSQKSSGKEKPPPYRTPIARQPPVYVADPTTPNPSHATDGGEPHEKPGETAPAAFVRGIPTADIVGSSTKKLPRLESKPSKISKVPRSTLKTSHEPTIENIDTTNPSSVNSPSDLAKTPRRNSLERPSFYNSLYNSGLRSYNGSVTRSLNLPAEHMSNGDTALSNEQFSKLDQYLATRTDNGDSSASEYDYHSVRPYGTLGRTLSLRGPRPNKLYTPDSEIESKYRRSPTNVVARGSGQFTSRFLRPKSFYGVSDLPDCEAVPTVPKTEVGVLLTEGRTPFVGRRSPSYQRSISLFEGKKANDYRLSVTPDRSVLGKFFPEKEHEKGYEKASTNENTETPKVRRHSRFLRPDFYDTPKEDSVYEKKEKIKNQVSNGEIWKEKEKISSVKHKKSSKKDDLKNQENRLSIVDKAIKSLKENTLSKIDRESMARESNLIQRAVSLEDCSIVPENRSRRSTSLTPQTKNQDSKQNSGKFEKMFQKKKVEDFKKIVDNKLNYKDKDYSPLNSTINKADSVLKKIVRKVSPKSLKHKISKNFEEPVTCNGSLESNTEEAGGYSADTRSRLSRIAGLKRLEFSRPLVSNDSTPSMEEGRFNGELDDSSSVLSPTEDGSDTWSISSDYTDARELMPTPTTGPEDSVSERIRRKSFYSRFNQSKRRKSSQSVQTSGSRSRLPMYSKSMSSDFTPKVTNPSNPVRKISDPDRPIDN